MCLEDWPYHSGLSNSLFVQIKQKHFECVMKKNIQEMFKGISRGWLASFVSTSFLFVLIVVMFELKCSISHVSACPSQVTGLVGYYSGSKYKEEAYYQPACPFPS